MVIAAAAAPSAPPFTGWNMQPKAASAVGLLSPYRRPAALQPLRLCSDLASLAWLASEGILLPRLGEDIQLLPSQGRGKGLFAARDFEDGAIIARYSGVRAPYEAFEAAWESGLTSGDYLLGAGVGEESTVYVDGTRAEDSALGRFVNHSVRLRNAALCCTEFASFGVEYVQTTRRVRAGEEFFVDYGSEYWDVKMGEWPLSPRRLAVDFL